MQRVEVNFPDDFIDFFIDDGSHTVILDSDGKVWTCGCNKYGQLGHGDVLSRSIFTKVEDIPFIISISYIVSHTLFIDSNGEVYGCGLNNHGQLGIGNNENQLKPVKIEGLRDIIFILATYERSIFIDKCGKVWYCGKNMLDDTDISIPKCLHGLPPIKLAVNLGYVETQFLFLDQDGNVWALGRISDDLFGVNGAVEPTKIAELSMIVSILHCSRLILFIDVDNNTWFVGPNFKDLGYLPTDGTHFVKFPANVDNLNNIKYACGTPYGFMLLTLKGKVFARGDFLFYRKDLTELEDIPLINSIRSNLHNDLLLDDNGNVWIAGKNFDGELGFPDVKDLEKFTQLPINNVVSLGENKPPKKLFSAKNARNFI